MKKYETMFDGTIDLGELTGEERAIFEEMRAFAEKDPEWGDLSNLFFKRVEETGALRKRTGYPYAFRQPLCLLHSDIEQRLCLRLQEKRKREIS